MRDTVTVSLPKEIRKKLDRLAKHEHLNRSNVVLEALRRYLVAWEFEEACKPLVVRARRQGIYADEDVFKMIS